MRRNFAKGWLDNVRWHRRGLEMPCLGPGFLERWHIEDVLQTYEVLVHTYSLTAHKSTIHMRYCRVDVVQYVETARQVCHVGHRQCHEGWLELLTAVE
jgi:hypothetical protein